LLLHDIIIEAQDNGISRYKINIKYKEDKIEFYFSKSELLKNLLVSSSPQQAIKLLTNIIITKFKLPKIDTNKLFQDIISLNIVNEKTQTSLQLNKIENLSSGNNSNFQILVGYKKGLGNNNMADITDTNNSDKTKNMIFDKRLQKAIDSFRTIVEKE
jgi:hypothetical protein